MSSASTPLSKNPAPSSEGAFLLWFDRERIVPRLSASVLRERRKKREAAKKAAAKKAAAKKPPAKKAAVKKSAVKKAPAKRLAATRPSANKAAAKRPAAKRPAAKRPAAKKTVANKTAASKRRSPAEVLEASRSRTNERRRQNYENRVGKIAAENPTKLPPTPNVPVDRVQTKGGEYKVYKKNSGEAKSFRKAFLAAKKDPKKLTKFKWRGRWYSTKEK